MASQGEVCGHFVQQGEKSWQPLLHESTEFFKAIVNGNEAEVAAFLGQNAELLNTQLTLLYWGADPKGPGPEASGGTKASVSVKHRTPLMIAAQSGSMGVVALLLHNGADVRIKATEDGLTAMQVALNSEARSASAIVDLLKEAESRRTSDSAASVRPSRDMASSEQAYHMDMANFGVQQQEAEAFNAEGFPFSTNELTRPEFAADEFRMYHFKVSRCCKKYAHDWRACPFAHPTENARRRNPREYRYCSIACPEYKQGFCARGDACSFAHGVFEGWLHPSRYRTQLCKDGANCHRAVCFFAHSLSELRTPTYTWMPSSEELSAAGVVAPPALVPMGASGAQVPAQFTVQPEPGAAQLKPSSIAGGVASVVAYDSLSMAANGFMEMPGGAEAAKAAASFGLDPGAAFPSKFRSTSGESHGSAAFVGSPDSHGGASCSSVSVASGVASGTHAAVENVQPQDSFAGHAVEQQEGYVDLAAGQPGQMFVGDPHAAAHAGDPPALPPAPPPLLGFTAPRMSNAFARRHGLNPKDNAMINLQKLAIQTQIGPALRSKHPQWNPDVLSASARGGLRQQPPRPSGRGGGRKGQQHGNWPGAGMPAVGPLAPGLQPQMYGMNPMRYGGAIMGSGMGAGMHQGGGADHATMAALNQSLMALNLHPQHSVGSGMAMGGMGGYTGGMQQQQPGGGYRGNHARGPQM